jgi:NUMOD3 motif
MIDVFGRIDLGTGILHNLTDGGDGTSGAIRSDETRRKISEAMKGKTHSEESKKRMSEASKNPSEETRRKMSERQKGEKNHNYGKTLSKEHRKKMSEASKGEKNPNYGKKWWNDGCGNIKYMIECPGDGWKPGMK